MTIEEIKTEWQSLPDAGNRKTCCKTEQCARFDGHPGDCVKNSFAALIPANLLRPIEASNDKIQP